MIEPPVRPTRLLLVVTGSHGTDVSAGFVRRHLDAELKAAQWNGVALVLLHGGASGVDAVADAWAGERGVPVQSIPAEWTTYGMVAGPVRNRQLLDVARRAERAGWLVRVVGFPGPRSSGTWDMVKLGREAGMRTDVHVEQPTTDREEAGTA